MRIQSIRMRMQLDSNEDPVDTDEDPVALEMKSENMMETGVFTGSLSEMKSGDFAGENR